MEGPVRLSPTITEQARLRIGIQNEAHVRRSPRIIQQAQLRMEIGNERQRQGDDQLQNRRFLEKAKRAAFTETERENCNEKRRILDKAKRSSMSEIEREKIREKRRIAYHAKRIRLGTKSSVEHKAQTSTAIEGSLPPRITVRGSPRLIEQAQRREHIQNTTPPSTQGVCQNPSVAAVFSTLMSSLQMTGTNSKTNKKRQHEMDPKQSLMAGAESEQLRDKSRIAHCAKRTRVGNESNNVYIGGLISNT